MKPFFAATITAILIAGQAQALSCMPPDIARTFNWMSEAEESYIVLQGEFAFDPPPQRPRTTQFEQQSVELGSVFEGRYLGPRSFLDAPPLDVTLNFVCLGPWCGSIEADEGDIIVFAQRTEDGYVLDVDPCFSSIFPSTTENVQRVEACMRGQSCDPQPF